MELQKYVFLSKKYNPDGKYEIQFASGDKERALKFGIPEDVFKNAIEIDCPVFGKAKSFPCEMIKKEKI